MSKFEELIVEQIPRLRRYARALVGERARADDLVQDTLERAWTRFHLWRHGSNLRAWLFTVMHNVFVNQYRNGDRGRTSSLDENFEIPMRDGSEVSMQMRDLHNSLAQLPDDFREVILLVGVEQLTYEEVSEVLNIPLGTVMSRLSRAREKLHVLMSGQVKPLRRIK
ncbi:MAG: RNA polymerase sigma factor [Pseudomonadota bacterium]